MENLAFKQGKFKGHFAFGDNSSPTRHINHDDTETAANSARVSPSRHDDDWSSDRWVKPTDEYTTMPDSEAATAIESLLNEELS